jgi:uncharacterized membrane protein (DUF2068 family)
MSDARRRLSDAVRARVHVDRTSGIRVIAALEAAKGLVVLIAGLGLLRFVHQDLEMLAEDLVRHFHLNPASRYPRIFLELADRLADVRLWLLALMAFAYASLRLVEAYGLWLHRRWAEWLAVASGALYVPIEIYELFKGLTPMKVATLALNVAIVAYMGWTLWAARRDAQTGRRA